MTPNSLYYKLSDNIVSSKEFITDFEQLLANNIFPNKQKLSASTFKRLIECAAIFACSENETHKRIALKIASSIMESANRNAVNNEILKAASELVFLRLGNFPLLYMTIYQYGTKDFFNIYKTGNIIDITPSISAEIIGKTTLNKLKISDNIDYITDFQADVFKSLRMGENISISAPTSAGKSYILSRYVIDYIKTIDKDSTGKFIIIYIVPTRALISQVQREFKKVLSKYSVSNVDILTSSWEIIGEGKKQSDRAIYVLTQERLQTIEGRYELLKADLLIVDEAQNIEVGARGIILESSIQQLINSSPSIQVIFISPFSLNPEKLGSIFSINNLKVFKTNFSPVSQNLVSISTFRNKVDVKCVSQELGKEIVIESKINGEKVPNKPNNRKAWVLSNFTKDGSTIVYCNRPHDCREVAEVISSYTHNKKTNNNIDQVIEFLAKTIHPQYYLIDYLKNGIGYHYGRMPQSARRSIELLFSDKDIDVICCTSTLLEGVNLAAKNIIIHKPKSGPNAMNDIAFLNLSGRAGRLMKDFHGNIFCIDVDKWDEDSYKPSIEKQNHKIKSSMEDVISEKKEKIIAHLK